MFDEATLNKLEAIYGTKYRKALEDYSNPPLLIGVTVLTSFSEDSL